MSTRRAEYMRKYMREYRNKRRDATDRKQLATLYKDLLARVSALEEVLDLGRPGGV